jgi:hypothetical protein
MPLSSYALERFFAPGIAGFHSADIPDGSSLDDQASHWIANHVLNSVLRASIRPPGNAYIFNFLRRAEGAFAEHANAREATLGFLESGGQALGRYVEALRHWEFFLSEAWNALAILRAFTRYLGDDETKLFSKGDGSLAERVNLLYNSMKHVESRIAAGQIEEDATIPVWLSNEVSGVLTP